MMNSILALLGLHGGEVLWIAILLAIAVMGLTGRLKRPRSFDPYLLVCVAVGAGIAILVLQAIARSSTVGSGESVLPVTVQAVLSILQWPMRCYVVGYLGALDPWSLPSLKVLLMNGLIRGIFIERIVSMFFTRKAAA
jgi:hypothetical protein